MVSSAPDADRGPVWVCRLIDVARQASAEHGRLLSADERARANLFVRQSDADRFRASRCALRIWLGMLMRTPPQKLQLATGSAAGGSILAPVRRSLSFSHVASHWAAAVGEIAGGAVGIDVECSDRFKGADAAMARMILSKAELDIWGELDEIGAAPALVCSWTRKQALLKAMGTGFGRPMPSLDVGFREKPHAICEPDAHGKMRWWQVRDISPLPHGMVGALAWESRDHDAHTNSFEVRPGWHTVIPTA